MPYVGAIANIPSGWALCNGSNGTPNLTGRFLEGVTSASAAKVSKSAGLPNITGTFTDCGFDWWPSSSGAFYYKKECSRGVHDIAGEKNGPRFYFDASRSSSIYGNSTTVQPASYTVMYIMKIK